MQESEYTGHSKEFEAALQEFLRHAVSISNRIKKNDTALSDLIEQEAKDLAFIIPKLANTKTKTAATQHRFAACRHIMQCGELVGEAVAHGWVSESEYLSWAQDAISLSFFKGFEAIPWVGPLLLIASLFDSKTKP